MERMYHNYENWEDWKLGFYDTVSGKKKDEMINTVVSTFKDPELTEKLMNNVIDNWVVSCEENLSNPSMNNIAYIGQACMCLQYRIPKQVTEKAWSYLSIQEQEEANRIAKEVFNKWKERYEY